MYKVPVSLIQDSTPLLLTPFTRRNMKCPDPVHGSQREQWWGACTTSGDPESPGCLSCRGEAEGDAIAFLETPARGQRIFSPQKTMLAQG